jgi:hypothetical protein
MVLKVTHVQVVRMISSICIEIEQFKIVVELFGFRVAQHTTQ